MEEIWKDIAGYEGLYQVSNEGRVKSLERTCWYNHSKTRNRHTKVNKERIIKLNIARGYYFCFLNKDGTSKPVRINRLVALTFFGYSDLHVNHIDHNRLNNKLQNLEYVTQQDNLVKMRLHNHIAGKTNTSYCKRSRKWRAYLNKNGKHKHIGLFNTQKEAYIAYENYKNKMQEL